MVKSYDRFEQEKCFGVIASQCNVVWIKPSSTQSSKSVGRAISAGLEEILVTDIKTGEVLQRLSDGLTPGASNAPTAMAPPLVSFLAYHEDTNIIASGYTDGSIKIWDLTSRSAIISFQGHKSAISVLQFDGSGTRLVSGSSDSTMILWDLVGEEGLIKLKGHKSQITGLRFLRENVDAPVDDLEDYLLSISKDGLIKLWDLKSQQCIETHLAYSSECWSLSINGSNDMAITCGSKDQVKIWSIDITRKESHKITQKGSFEKVSKARCTGIEFRYVKVPGGGYCEMFYLQNVDRTIEIFRLRSEDEIKRGIAKRTKRLKAKGLEEEEILKEIHDSEIDMLICPFTVLRTAAKVRSCNWARHGSNKNLEMLVSLTNNSLEYYSVKVPENIPKASQTELSPARQHTVDLLGHRSDIRAMDIASDNRLLATASNGELKIWNLKTTNVIRTFVLDGGYALCCKFLPGGSLVAIGYKNGDLELYDLATSSLVDKVEKAHESSISKDEESGSAIWSMDLTPDGKTLVTGGNDKAVKFWNFEVEQEIIPGTQNYISKLKFVHSQTLEVNEDVLCVKISSDAKFLAISLLNNNVQVVFFDTLKLFLTLYGHKLPVLSIDISHDSKLIITSSADKNIKIWGLDFGDCHKSIFGHQDSIMNVKFIPDTHHFFSSGKDGLIKYWDGDKFECIQKLPAHKSEVWCLALSSDGSFMVSSSHDHSIRLWAATEDQVFLEEEREKEMDEMYENTLLESLEDENQDRHHENDDDDETNNNDEVSKVSKQTMETLKAGEKLMEAIDIGIEDVNATEEYNSHLQAYNANKTMAAPVKPTPHAILVAFGISGQEHVLKTLLAIKSAQLDDALLVLPFSYSLKMLKFIEIWTNGENITNNVTNMALICKVLFFIIKSNANEFIHQKDAGLKNQLINVKAQLRDGLSQTLDILGFNISGLKFVKQQWKLVHEAEYIDEAEQRQHQDKKAFKRTYTTI